MKPTMRTKDHGETWTNWWLLPRMTEEEALEFVRENNIERYNDGPGGPFARRPVIRLGRTRTLITHYCGYDV